MHDPDELFNQAATYVRDLDRYYGRRWAREDGAEWLADHLIECVTNVPYTNAIWESQHDNPEPLRRHEAIVATVERDCRLCVCFLLDGERENARIAFDRAYDALPTPTVSRVA